MGVIVQVPASALCALACDYLRQTLRQSRINLGVHAGGMFRRNKDNNTPKSQAFQGDNQFLHRGSVSRDRCTEQRRFRLGMPDWP